MELKRIRKFSSLPDLYPWRGTRAGYWVGHHVGYVVMKFSVSGRQIGGVAVSVMITPEGYTGVDEGVTVVFPGIWIDYNEMVSVVKNYLPVSGENDAKNLANWIRDAVTSAAHEEDSLYGSMRLEFGKSLSKYEIKWHFDFFEDFLRLEGEGRGLPHLLTWRPVKRPSP